MHANAKKYQTYLNDTSNKVSVKLLFQTASSRFQLFQPHHNFSVIMKSINLTFHLTSRFANQFTFCRHRILSQSIFRKIKKRGDRVQNGIQQKGNAQRDQSGTGSYRYKTSPATGQVQRCFFNCDRKQVSNYISNLLPSWTKTNNERVNVIITTDEKFQGLFSVCILSICCHFMISTGCENQNKIELENP